MVSGGEWKDYGLGISKKEVVLILNVFTNESISIYLIYFLKILAYLILVLD